MRGGRCLCNSHFPAIVLAWLAWFFSSVALGAAPTEITYFQLGSNSLTLEFHNDGSSNRFTLQASLGLDEGNWANAASATLTPLGDNRYRFVLPRSSADREFFRIIGSFLSSGLDPDGDGLPTTLEDGISSDPNSPLYSNSSVFDTDDDGFSDGAEYAFGTEPNNANSFPDQASLPAVEFSDAQSEVTEGIEAHQIPVVSADGYSGTVYYSINPRGTASSPEDFQPVSGTLNLVNGAGSISMSWVDDLELSPQRLVMIDLSVDPPGNAYRASGNVTHVVLLGDNDNYWTGVLRDDIGERNFRVRMVRNASTTELSFVAGKSDGLPVVDDGTSSQSTGVVPVTNLAGDAQESFAASGVVHTLSRFSAHSPDLPVRSDGIFGDVSLMRNLSLDANPDGDSTHNLTENTIVGGFTELIRHATDPSITYLDATVSGVFVLTRDLPGAAELESALRPE